MTQVAFCAVNLNMSINKDSNNVMANLNRFQTMPKTAINSVATPAPNLSTHDKLLRVARRFISRLVPRLGVLSTALFLIGILCTAAHAATLTSVVNRKEVGLNESFMLLLSIDEQVPSSALDLSPLRQDFEILGMSPNSSSSVSIVSGQAQRESSTSWRIALSPRRQGVLTIPALQVAGATSEAIAITVSAAGQEALTAELTVDSATVLPEQQILVTITLSAASNVGDLSGPSLQIDNADVIELGNNGQQTMTNGIARQEFTLQYAVFAQEAGTLTIPSLTFTGSEGGSASIFSNRGRQVVARTQSRTLEVQANPSNAPKPWLVADDISIQTQWLSDAQAARVGEPLTRRISITALGQQAEAIAPLLNESNETAYRSYQDQAQLQSLSEATGIRGIRNESEVIIPNRAGTIVLPAQQLRYWNTRTNQVKTVTLEAETLEVLPAVASNQESNNSDSDANNAAATNPNKAANNVPGLLPLSAPNSAVWIWLVAALTVLCAVQTVYIITLRRAATSKSDAVAPVRYNAVAEETAWAELDAQLKAKHWQAANSKKNTSHVDQAQFQALRKATLLWASTYFAQPVSIHSLALLLGSAGEQELRKLDQLAFAHAPTQSLKLKQLSAALSQLRNAKRANRSIRHHSAHQPTAPLPNLYPS